MTWVVLAASGERGEEARASAHAFADGGRARRAPLRVSGRLLPERRGRHQDAFEELKPLDPDLILTHTRDDLHQDHRLACELTWNTFRDHLILEYEVPKWDGDLGRPNVFVPLTAETAETKVRLLHEHFPSQRDKDWFDAETFKGLMRLRGLEIRSGGALRRGVRRPQAGPRLPGRHRPRSGRRRWRSPVRVLVTGHHGYIGSVMVTAIRAAGHEVVGLDTYLYEDCDFGLDAAPPVDAIRADVRDVGPEVLAGFDAVVHLAALSNDPIGDLNPDWTRDINFAATVRLARLAKEVGVGRFVFASSCSLYGSGRGDEAVDEETALRPLTPYAESKARSEEALLGLADGDFAPTSMRNATAYGVSPRLRLDVVLNNLVAWAHTTGRVRLAERRHCLATTRPHPRHRRATVALLDASPGSRGRAGVQHRLRRAELPHPGPRRDRSRTPALERRRARGRCVARRA